MPSSRWPTKNKLKTGFLFQKVMPGLFLFLKKKLSYYYLFLFFFLSSYGTGPLCAYYGFSFSVFMNSWVCKWVCLWFVYLLFGAVPSVCFVEFECVSLCFLMIFYYLRREEAFCGVAHPWLQLQALAPRLSSAAFSSHDLVSLSHWGRIMNFQYALMWMCTAGAIQWI